MKDVFQRIYQEKVWTKGSGSGSLPSNTVAYRAFLQSYLRTNHIRSMIDCGCGDWKVMKLMDLSGIIYTGVDVVSPVIKSNKRLYESPTVRFLDADVRSIQLPDADLVILKDVLQHWSSGEIARFLARLQKYPRVLVVNTCEGENLNGEIHDGGIRPVDLSQAPFHLQTKELLRYQSTRPKNGQIEIKNVIELNAGEHNQ